LECCCRLFAIPSFFQVLSRFVGVVVRLALSCDLQLSGGAVARPSTSPSEV
jgi:hypothetical protein